jgi:TRAP transporter TAXI family solute receptor
MKKSRLISHVLVFFVLTMIFSTPSYGAQKYRATFGTGGNGGVFYIIGAGMADLINKNSDFLEVTAQSTSAATENINLCHAGQLQFGLAHIDSAYFGYVGDREFKGKTPLSDIRLVMMGHLGAHTSVVWKDSPYLTLGDLKGKNISTSPGPNGKLMDDAHFKPWGVELPPRVPVLSYTEMATAMKDGTIDVANYHGDHPGGAILDMANTKPIRILGQTEETLAEILNEFPYWVRTTIPGGMYTGQDEDVLTWATQYAVVCNKDVPDEIIREFMRIVFENDLTKIHPAGEFYTKNHPAYKQVTGKGELLPLHPAAKAYLIEIGAIEE